jgi:hypothetical protein
VRGRLERPVALPAAGGAVEVPAGGAWAGLAPGVAEVLVQQGHGSTLGERPPPTVDGNGQACGQ